MNNLFTRIPYILLNIINQQNINSLIIYETDKSNQANIQ